MVWKNACRRLNLKSRTLMRVIWLFLLLSILLISCEKETKILMLELDIAELICKDGQNILEGRILELEGIKTVSTNIETHKAQIRFRENMISAAEIQNHLFEFGFTIDNEPGNQIARGRLPQCCFAKRTTAE